MGYTGRTNTREVWPSSASNWRQLSPCEKDWVSLVNTRHVRRAPVAPLLLDATECGWSNPCQCPYHQHQRDGAVSTPPTMPELSCLRLAAQEYALARVRGDVAGMLRSAQMLATLSLCFVEQANAAWRDGLPLPVEEVSVDTLAELAPLTLRPSLRLNA